MSIDFSTLKGLTIPEGNVSKIEDAQGNVLWSAVKMATITLKWEPYSYALYDTTSYISAKVKIEGTEYWNSFFIDNAIDQYTLSVPLGTTIICYYYALYGGYVGEVKINGNTVAQDVGNNSDNAFSKNRSEYEYVVTTDAIITLTAKANSTYPSSRKSESVYITEIRNDPATITITGDDADYLRYASVTINGTSYNSGRYDGETVSIEVAAGTVIECSAFCPASGTTGGTYVAVNGTNVKTATGTASYISYDYVVTGNASIRLRSKAKYSNIAITET